MRKKKHYTQFTCRIEDELLEEIRRIVLKNDLYSINVLSMNVWNLS